MRWMMTWMMAATLFVVVSALPGCETPDDSHKDGSGTKSGTTDDGTNKQGSQDKDSERQGSGYR